MIKMHTVGKPGTLRHVETIEQLSEELANIAEITYAVCKVGNIRNSVLICSDGQVEYFENGGFMSYAPDITAEVLFALLIS